MRGSMQRRVAAVAAVPDTFLPGEGGTPPLSAHENTVIVPRPLVGCSYRFDVAPSIERRLDELGVIEVMVDHYLNADDKRRHRIEELVGRVPIVTHGVGLSLGTAGLPDGRYLERVARCLDALGARYYSEHVAFTRAGGTDFGDLLPLPRRPEIAEHIIRNVNYVKGFLTVPFYLENIVYYFDYSDATMSDPEFFSLICRETGCKALLDAENLYVNFLNYGNDPKAFIDALPADGVGAMHLAGGHWIDGVFVDDHGYAVPDGALEAMRYALSRHRPSAVIVERDRNLGDGSEYLAEVGRVRRDIVGLGERIRDSVLD
jgi:uncharacterized protein